MNLEGGAPRRGHPFGRGANWLVVGGVSLSLLQSLAVAMAAFAAPLLEGFELEGTPLLAWLLLGVGIPLGMAWLAWRALRAWWRRSVSVFGRILLIGLLSLPATVLLAVPVGGEIVTPLGYLPAGLLSVAGALVARPRIAAAQRQGRGGLAP